MRYIDYQGLRKCLISSEVIAFTENVLLEYGNLNPPNEGLLYWGGTKDEGIGYIDIVIAPKCNSGPQRISTSHHSNALVVKNFSLYKRIQIAQVHSHPSKWVDHSFGDDELAPFKVNGLLSIVVPSFGHQGMLPLYKCGIHLYWNLFERLPTNIIKKVFDISDSLNATLIDLRYDKTINC